MGYIPMQTLRHTAAFDQAAKAFSEAELDQALDMIARNPECGDLIPGTGGVRKVRVAASGTRQAWRRAGDLLLVR